MSFILGNCTDREVGTKAKKGKKTGTNQLIQPKQRLFDGLGVKGFYFKTVPVNNSV